jgi:hypothetical protein
MPSPAFAPNDRVLFTAPFVDNIVYTITRIQYLTENNEFTDEVTENWQYEMVQGITNSFETFLEAAP